MSIPNLFSRRYYATFSISVFIIFATFVLLNYGDDDVARSPKLIPHARHSWLWSTQSTIVVSNNVTNQITMLSTNNTLPIKTIDLANNPEMPHAGHIVMVPQESSDVLAHNRTMSRKALSALQRMIEKSRMIAATTSKPTSDTTNKFCDVTVNKVYTKPLKTCSKLEPLQGPVQCLMGEYLKIGRCVFDRVALSMQDKVNLKFTEGAKDECGLIDIETLKKTFMLEDGHLLTQSLVGLNQNGVAQCDSYRNETILLYQVGHHHHVYHRMLGWYEVYKTLRDFDLFDDENHTVVFDKSLVVKTDHSEDELKKLQDFEQVLFPNTEDLHKFNEKLGKNNVCFKRVIPVPWTFANFIFRCITIYDPHPFRDQCMQCNGLTHQNNQIKDFEKYVLSACGIQTVIESSQADKVNILVMERRPYIRFKTDDVGVFKRSFVNSNDVVQSLNQLSNDTKYASIGVNVTSVDFSDIATFCDQVQIVRNSDILIGVHGSGLTHLWWMKPKSLLIEIVPSRNSQDWHFRIISTLSGKKHKIVNEDEKQTRNDDKNVFADVNEILEAVKNHLVVYL